MSSRPPRSTAFQGSYASAKAAYDSESDDDMSVSDDDGDIDWLPSVPGRPGPYSTTWSQVYAPLTVNGDGTITIACQESGDGNIVMNKSYQEQGSASIPAHKAQRPPVCHIVPWVAINEGIRTKLPQGKTATAGFEKFACWGDTGNLQTGHTSCNGCGVKTTLLTMTASERAAGTSHVAAAILEWSGGGNGLWYE